MAKKKVKVFAGAFEHESKHGVCRTEKQTSGPFQCACGMYRLEWVNA